MDLARLDVIKPKHIYIILGVIFLILYIYLMLTDPPRHDVVLFQKYAEMFKAGTLFNSGVVSGYPPLAWIFIIVPGLFTSDLQSYYEVFAAVDVVCMFLIGVLLYRICKDRTKYPLILLAIYVIITVIYSDHAVRKFDIIPVLFMMVSIYLFLEKKKYSWAVIVALLGGLIKYFPALLIPIFIFMVMKDREALKDTMKGFVICIVLGVAAVAALILSGTMDFASLLGFISSQDARGFHIESTVGTTSVVICHLMGMPTDYVPSTDFTVDVDNAICNAMIGWWMYLFYALVILSFALFFITQYRKRCEDEEDFYKYLTASSLAMILVFILFNKVFSTQFIQWFYPLLIMFLCYREPREGLVLSVLTIAISALSRYFLNTESQEIMLLRDILLFVMMFLAFRYVITRKWSLGLDEERPPIEEPAVSE